MFPTDFTPLIVLLLFPLSIPSSSLCKVFDSISSNIYEVLSINPSANVFVFGDVNVHHKDWLTYSSGTDRSGELCYNFSISNGITQTLLLFQTNFPTQIPDCDSHSSALLDLFISSDANICSTVAFPPLGNSDNVVSQFSLTFHHIHNGMLHFIALLMTILVLIGTVFVII